MTTEEAKCVTVHSPEVNTKAREHSRISDAAKSFVAGFEGQSLYAVFDPLERRAFIRPVDKPDNWTPVCSWLQNLADVLDVQESPEKITSDVYKIESAICRVLIRQGKIED